MTAFENLTCECNDKKWSLGESTRAVRCPECGVLFSRMGEMVYSYNRGGYLLAQIKSMSNTPTIANTPNAESLGVILATSTDDEHDQKDKLNDVKDQL